MAICSVESDHRPLAVNLNDNGAGNHSIGFCQVSYQTALTLGMQKQETCKLDFKDTKLRTVKNCKLFDKATNLYYAEKYLKKQLKRYGNDIKKTISSYNAGSYSTKNNSYVRKVLRRFK